MSKLFYTACLLFLGISQVFSGRVLLETPRDKITVFRGAPQKNYHTMRSRIVRAEPNTWYRLSVEIKCAFKKSPGRLTVNVRNIRESGKSIVYSNIVKLAPAFLDFNKFSGIFLTKAGTAKLQVYYHAPRMNGYAEFRNLRLEKLDPDEAEAARKALNAKPAVLSAPVYAFDYEKSLSWGYRVGADLLAEHEIPAKITFKVPQLGISETVPVTVNKHIVHHTALKKSLRSGGKYRIEMAALDANGKAVVKHTSFLRVIKRPAYAKRLPVKSVSIDKRGNTVINGKPVLLNGLYHVYSASNFRDVGEAGFNSVLAWTDKPHTYLRMLNHMKDNDLYADCVLKLIKGQPLKELMKKLGGHETIISFDLVDEPDIKSTTMESIMETRRQISQAFPGRPFRISLASASAGKRFAHCVEILAAHDYVIPFGGLERLAQSTAAIVKAAGRDKSPHMTLQSWIHWHDPHRIPQTPGQTKSMAYLALIRGAKGLWWYSFIDKGSWDVRTVPSIWTTFKGLNAQLYDLAETILTGKRLPVKSADQKIECALWKTSKRAVFVIVNKDKAAQKAQFTGLPANCLLAELYADGEKFKVVSGKVTIPVNGEDVRIFEVKN